MPLHRPLILILLVLLVAAGWWRLRPAPGFRQETRLLMGTTVTIEAGGAPGAELDRAIGAAFDEMARVEGLMSSYRDDSDVARLNAAADGAEVSAETAAVIRLGLEISRRSGGAFDLALGRLKALWGIDGEAPRIPAAGEIAAALAGSGSEAVSLVGTRVGKRRPESAVDLGGIAKGYAVDRALAVLREHGISSAAVNAGGDIGLLGGKGERPWRVAIQHPRRSDAVLATVAQRGGAVVTSGDYERFFERDGQRYHHLFDPHTGYPAQRCQSVTVIAPTAMLADALATALFVLGPQAGLEMLRGYPGCEALIIAADGRVVRSAGLAGLEIAEP